MSLASSWLTGRPTGGQTRRGESFRTRRLVGKPILPGTHLDDHGLAFLKSPPDPAGGVERPAAFGDLGPGCVGQADRRVRVGRDGDLEAELPVYEFPRRGAPAVQRLERGASIRGAAARLRLDADVLVAGLFRVGLEAGHDAVEPLADGPAGVVIERVHPRILKAAVRLDAVPAFPDRRRAH